MKLSLLVELFSFPIRHGDLTLTHLPKQGINFLPCGGKNYYSFFSLSFYNSYINI